MSRRGPVQHGSYRRVEPDEARLAREFHRNVRKLLGALRRGDLRRAAGIEARTDRIVREWEATIR